MFRSRTSPHARAARWRGLAIPLSLGLLASVAAASPVLAEGGGGSS